MGDQRLHAMPRGVSSGRGAAGDRIGRRRVFVVGITIFAIASVWCGLAPNVAQLIVARALQGIGAALLVPCSLAIIGASFSEADRGKAIGTWAGFSAIASAVGPLLGSWIVDHMTWQAIFLINPFLALPAIWIALRHVPESYDPEAPPGIDWVGSLLAFGGLGSVAFGLIALPDRDAGDVSPAARSRIVICRANHSAVGCCVTTKNSEIFEAAIAGCARPAEMA